MARFPQDLKRIVSGGQTGADRAALDWAIEHGVAHGGWCPRGRRAEDGALDVRYLLAETASAGYRERTRLNVIDSDATLIVNLGALDGGSLYTQGCAQRAGRPVLVVQADKVSACSAARDVLLWLASADIGVLNIAGPRESKRRGAHAATRALLEEMAARGLAEPF